MVQILSGTAVLLNLAVLSRAKPLRT